VHEPLTAPGAYLRTLLDTTTPGFACGVWQEGRALDRDFEGEATREPERHPVTARTLFDLASLTKPLATALLALKAHSEGAMDLEAPVLGVPGPRFTPLDLLRHEAGFPAWAPLYGVARDRVGAFRWLGEECPREPAGRRAVYSCPGYLLLGHLVEEFLQGELSALFQERVAAPLGLLPREAFFRPAGPSPDVAATELRGEHEAALARQNGVAPPSVPPGGLWGVVHDGNARFLGGAAGNAGLFATLAGVAKLARGFFPSSGFLPAGVLEWAWTPGRCLTEQVRTAGFRHASDPGWAAGAALPSDAVGHEGFTGTGVWLERESERVYILLTNRIHPRHPGTDFGPVRAEFLRRARKQVEAA